MATLTTMASNNLPSYSLVQSMLVQLHDRVGLDERLAIEALSEAIEKAVSRRWESTWIKRSDTQTRY
jgi:hypothetical protein